MTEIDRAKKKAQAKDKKRNRKSMVVHGRPVIRREVESSIIDLYIKEKK